MPASAVSLKEIVEAAVDAHRDRVGPLLPVLPQVQDQPGFVPPDAGGG